jgi:WD40 repeat protein
MTTDPSLPPPADDPTDHGPLDGITFAAGLPRAGSAAGSGPDVLLGRSIGGIVITRLVAEGGMGRVYEGLQEKPRRTVAVKVMRPGIASAAMLARFEREAEMLARLRHPGIAHVYEVGTCPSAQGSLPYFVMEFIPEARTILAFAEDYGLSTARRLELFRSVCDAVAHGHRAGIVHRDLKPANILVDATGQPKVIDFGVARSLVAEAAAVTILAEDGQLVGTLQYMSPEQFAGDPASVDARSDVYALGVVLCELLVGAPPYDLRRKSIVEAARIVADKDLTLPAARGLLRGGLGAIVGMCLARDPRRRYADAAALAADIGRHLAGDPLEARPPTLLQSVGRLARRHRTAVIAASSLVAAMILAIAGISVFLVRAEQERAFAERQRAIADAARARAEGAAADARWGMYRANLQKLVTIAEGAGGPWSREFIDETQELVATDRRPLELSVLEAGLDRSTAVVPGPSAGLAVSPGGRRFAILRDGGVGIHDATSGARVAAIAAGDSRIRQAVLSHDGDRLVAVSADGSARVHDAATGGEVAVLRGHAGAVRCADFAADGRRVITGAADGTARVWDAGSGASLAVLDGHEGTVWSVALSPDGTRAATACSRGTRSPVQAALVRIWDVAAKPKSHSVPGNDPGPVRLGFSPDGRRIVVAFMNGTTRLLDGDGGAELALLARSERVFVNTGFKFAFSPDGSRVATAGTADGEIRIWDAATGGEVAVLEGHEQFVTDIAYSPDGRRLLSASADGTARLWDAGRWAAAAKPLVHDGVVLDVGFAGDGDQFLTRAVGGAVRLWKWPDCGERCVTLRGGSETRAVAFSPDGRILAVVEDDGSTRLWDVAAAREVACLSGHGSTKKLVFSPDGTRLATIGRPGTQLWNTATGALVADLRGTATFVECGAFSPDGTQFATGSLTGKVQLWDGLTGAALRPWQPGDPADNADDGLEDLVVADFEGDGWAPWTVEGTAFGSGPSAAVQDGRQVFAGVQGGRFADSRAGGADAVGRVRSPPLRIARPFINLLVVSFGLPGNACVNLLVDGTAVRTAFAPNTQLVPVTWDVRDLAGRDAVIEIVDGMHGLSPRGREFCIAVDQIVQSVRPASVAETAVLEAHVPSVTALSFSPDGRRLLTVSTWDSVLSFAGQSLRVGCDRTVRVWDVRDGRCIATFPGHCEIESFWWLCPVGAAFSPDGERIVVISGAVARVWSVKTGREVVVLEGHDSAIVRAVFSPDGTRILTVAGDGARVWDAATGVALAVLRGHGVSVIEAAYSADGTRIVTAAMGRTVRIWDAATGAGLAVLSGGRVGMECAAVSPVGGRIATWSTRGRDVGLWGLSNAEVTAARKSVVGTP